VHALHAVLRQRVAVAHGQACQRVLAPRFPCRLTTAATAAWHACLQGRAAALALCTWLTNRRRQPPRRCALRHRDDPCLLGLDRGSVCGRVFTPRRPPPPAALPAPASLLQRLFCCNPLAPPHHPSPCAGHERQGGGRALTQCANPQRAAGAAERWGLLLFWLRIAFVVLCVCARVSVCVVCVCRGGGRGKGSLAWAGLRAPMGASPLYATNHNASSLSLHSSTPPPRTPSCSRAGRATPRRGPAPGVQAVRGLPAAKRGRTRADAGVWALWPGGQLPRDHRPGHGSPKGLWLREHGRRGLRSRRHGAHGRLRRLRPGPPPGGAPRRHGWVAAACAVCWLPLPGREAAPAWLRGVLVAPCPARSGLLFARWGPGYRGLLHQLRLCERVALWL
jgi:hypothetical protein